jgi:hypothetical protein
MSFQQIKPTIRKKNNVIQIGSSTQHVGVSGNLSVEGSVEVKAPFSDPGLGENSPLKVFSFSQNGFQWATIAPNTLLTFDSTSGVDYMFVQSTRGFTNSSDWVLNPGGTNMESGKAIFSLDSKLFISGSGINSGLHYEHDKGERLMSLSVT